MPEAPIARGLRSGLGYAATASAREARRDRAPGAAAEREAQRARRRSAGRGERHARNHAVAAEAVAVRVDLDPVRGALAGERPDPLAVDEERDAGDVAPAHPRPERPRDAAAGPAQARPPGRERVGQDSAAGSPRSPGSSRRPR